MGLSEHFPILAIAVPLFIAVIIPIVAQWKRSLSMPLAGLALTSSLILSALLIPEVSARGHLSYYLGSWEPPFGIEIRIDFLGLLMMILVSAVCLVVVIYSRKYVSVKIVEDRIATYYSLFLLLSGAMLGFCTTGDIFNMFVFLEIVAITSYALVAIEGSGKATKAAFKYLLMGAPSSILILLAISLLYSVTGTLNMADLTLRIASSGYTQVIIAAYLIFIVGFAVKAALFPLHAWLPDAHSIAPSPISALLSGLLVKIGILGIIRLTYSVYTVHFSTDVNGITQFLPWIGAVAIIYGSFMTIKQRDLKMMIAYSTVAHVGYIFVGIGLLNTQALTGCIYHIVNHCLAKACLFLCAGSIIYQSGYRKIEDLKGASRQMPLTCAAFTLASLSVVGIPPTAGFISKWYLVWGSLNAGNVFLVVVILLGSVMAAVYCFRVVYCMFFLPPSRGAWQELTGEAPVSMVCTSWILAVATVVLGILAIWILPTLQQAMEAFFI